MEGVAARWIEPSERAGGANSRVLTAELRAYVSALIQRFDRIGFGDPSELFRTAHARSVPPAKLTSLWVPPLVSAAAASDGSAPWLVQAGVEVTLEQALGSTGRQAHVLLAGPGGGKSTVCRYLCCVFGDRVMASNELTFEHPIPIYVPLRGLDPGREPAENLICAAALASLGGMPNRAAVERRLVEEMPYAYLILDGLDEIPRGPGRAEAVEQVIETINYLVEGYPTLRLLVTCREFDYASETSLRVLNLPILTLNQFSRSQVQEAVRRWHEAGADMSARNRGEVADWRSRGEVLLGVIDADPELAELARTPLLLNVIQMVFDRNYRMPRSISRLCRRAVTFMAIERPRERRAAAELDSTADIALTEVGEGLVFSVLGLLAFDIHQQLSTGGPASVPVDTLIRMATLVLNAGTIQGFRENGHLIYPIVAHLLHGNGVLAEIEPGMIGFTHGVFREVLAGEVLGTRSLDELRVFAQDENWHAPLRYWAGLRNATRDGVAEVLAVSEELLAPGPAAEIPTATCVVVAEMLLEVLTAAEPAQPMANATRLKEVLRNALPAMLCEREVGVSLRIRIGDVLGRLGDPRIAREPADYADVTTWTRMVPRVAQRIGRETAHQTDEAKYLEAPCCPPRTVQFERFSVGTFPVTNQEFRMFVQAGGYEEPRYWDTEESRLWQQEDEELIGELLELTVRTAPKHFKTRPLGPQLAGDQPDHAAARLLRRRRPLFWGNPLLSQPNQPVVGVNWWEARAFCKWLEEALLSSLRVSVGTIRVDLPSEFDWERVGRPTDDGRRFPWGDDDSSIPALLGVAEEKIARPGAIGLFPWATWDGGPLDLIGNVWEWTRSRPLSYAVDSLERDDTSGTHSRIVRGSSWLSREIDSRELTFRSFDPPCNAYEDLGFRVALYAG